MLSLGTEKPLFMGVDMSINHGALVVIDRSADVVAHRILSTRQKDLKLPGVEMIPKAVTGTSADDMHVRSVERLSWLKGWYQRAIHGLRAELGVLRLTALIEDYAYGAARGAHQIGESGGLLRIVLSAFCDLRFYSPTSAKSFAAGSGRAKKDDMIRAVTNWGVDVPDLAAAVAEDYCDAYALARMGLLEWEVRKGWKELTALTQRERDIFLSGGKKGDNLLTRPYVTLETK